MADPFPDYDVLTKRNTPSWDDITRKVIEDRLELGENDSTLSTERIATLRRVVERIAPQPEGRQPANTLALLLRKISANEGDGYRPAMLPQLHECWERGLDAIEEEARLRHRRAFASLDGDAADAILRDISAGEVRAPAWLTLPARMFWSWRLLPDILSAHWAHPSLWSAMGFGGPASPRGYVRLDADRRDPWEAEERSIG